MYTKMHVVPLVTVNHKSKIILNMLTKTKLSQFLLCALWRSLMLPNHFPYWPRARASLSCQNMRTLSSRLERDQLADSVALLLPHSLVCSVYYTNWKSCEFCCACSSSAAHCGSLRGHVCCGCVICFCCCCHCDGAHWPAERSRAMAHANADAFSMTRWRADFWFLISGVRLCYGPEACALAVVYHLRRAR